MNRLVRAKSSYRRACSAPQHLGGYKVVILIDNKAICWETHKSSTSVLKAVCLSTRPPPRLLVAGPFVAGGLCT